MGLFRKMASLGTLGAIDFRSDKERTASYARRTRSEAIRQRRILERQLVVEQQASASPALTELERLAQMRSEGWLTDEEFGAAKAQLLGLADTPKRPSADQRSFAPPAPNAPPGWYPDPGGQGERWWGGDRWASNPRR